MEGRICHQRLSNQACQVTKVPNCGLRLLGSPKRPSNHVGSLGLPMSAASLLGFSSFTGFKFYACMFWLANAAAWAQCANGCCPVSYLVPMLAMR
ncbi:hypothetical protein M441DRAFT_448270 [Trichoderma asperellum CBS 433.97]|uniref:Uncharacterized protein n=1 Tax=Trichoderma asperellum (strain ATCC 204424 / CBS 433.97 / NBRC 101777) TaxID=1042311 RepID=A0A2T3YX92_TRIA4|nr:hypothetical protein M441DRAFT_448270 [Trichoderma asperellum CBS 433.97]PTB37185.1 hypothetical protein M441DRAFT_448270 [Trichoderma asperellum CBS 433.97]